jgi:RNA polymerase sigma factor (TIGR02999 family)
MLPCVSDPLADVVTQLLVGARLGDDEATARICEQFYHELRAMAHARLRSQQPMTLLDTTVLVHESFLRLANVGQVAMADRNHFLAYAARVMRSVIIDVVRRRNAERRGGDLDRVPLDTEIVDSVVACEDDVLRVSDALEELAKADPRAAQVVEMRYFGGMADNEIADVLGVTERTVGRDWRKAKLLLYAVLNQGGM